MPRTKGAKNKNDPNKDPLARWDKLKLYDKFICYQYWRYINTGSEEGWNPANAGSVTHRRSSFYLTTLGSDSWFRHRGQAMVTLAQRFAELNEWPPEEPQVPNPPRVQRPQPQQACFATPPQSTMQSPGGRRTSVPLGEVAPSPAAQVEEEEKGGLVVPTCFGRFKKFNYTTRKTTTNVLVRQILHNGVSDRDIEFEWEGPRVLKIRVA